MRATQFSIYGKVHSQPAKVAKCIAYTMESPLGYGQLYNYLYAEDRRQTVTPNTFEDL
jgi:hypothetical protein